MTHIYLYSHFFFFNDTATTEIYTLSLHDALPISYPGLFVPIQFEGRTLVDGFVTAPVPVEGVLLLGADVVIAVYLEADRSEEHTSELQSRLHLVCRLLLEKKHEQISALSTHITRR